MKIIHSIQVEDGDTLSSITQAMSAYLGKEFNSQTVWDFNRNHMPSPAAMPPVGTVLRFPHDPADKSGAPGLDKLRNSSVTDADLAASDRVLGGVRTPNTPGGEVGATDDSLKTATPPAAAPAPADDDGFTES